MKIGDYETHPVADVFPPMDEFTLAGLVDDIKANGLQRKPVRLPDGRILDGRNRLTALLRLGVTPEFEEYTGSLEIGALASYVWSHNGARRDLDPGQRAICGRKLQKLCLTRRTRSLKQPDLPMPGVDEKSDEQAKMLLESGATGELMAAVEAGVIPLEYAIEAARMEPDSQIRLIERLKTTKTKCIVLTADDLDTLRSGYDALGDHPSARLIERMVPAL